jgi:hypothetical protein
MCKALRELMKPEIEAEIKAAVKEKDEEIAQLKKQHELYASKG